MASGSAMPTLLLFILAQLARQPGIEAGAPGRNNVTEPTRDYARDVPLAPSEEPTKPTMQQQQQQQQQQRRKETSTIMDTLVAHESQIKPNATSSNRTNTAFMPSPQLGPIIAEPEDFPKDPLPTRSPFNNVLPTKPGKSLFNSVRAIQFNNGQPDDDPQSHHHDNRQLQPAFRPSDQDSSFVKFVDDKGNDERPHRHPSLITSVTQAKNVAIHKNVADTRHGEPLPPDDPQNQQGITYIDESYDSEQQQQQQQQHQQQYVTYESKPASKFHEAPAYGLPYQQASVPGEHAYAQQYQHAAQLEPYHGEELQKLVQPETVINVHPVSYQSTSFDPLTNPKTIVYVTSHELPHTRKHHPYAYYQPQVFEHTEAAPVVIPEHTDEPYAYPVYYDSQPKTISPWKKILHVIGAFLPLGLLLALLSPRIINADMNNSDPNIILSKLRVNDLPAEHKHNQNRPPPTSSAQNAATTAAPAECEERSICKLINAADSRSANFLRHLLVHVAERTPESAVRKKELDRIFEAAKLGNCDILTCGFYDGT